MNAGKSKQVVGTVAVIVVAIAFIAIACYRWGLFPAGRLSRERAKAEWLRIAESGQAQNGSEENARVLMQCFKKGDLASEYSEILATGQMDLSVPGKTMYMWIFNVPKPKEPDATHYLVTVYVEGKPAVITSIIGVYSQD